MKGKRMRLDTAALALTGATLALLAPATLLAEESGFYLQGGCG